MPAFAYVESKHDRKRARETAALSRAAAGAPLLPFRRTRPANPVLDAVANELRQAHIRALAGRKAA